MDWQLSPYLFPLLFSALLAGVIGFVAWRRRQQSSAVTVTILMTAVAIWALGDAAQHSITNMRSWEIWNNLSYVGIASVPTIWLVYAIQTVGKDHWLTPQRLTLLSLGPILCLLAVWTNSAHYLYYTTVYSISNGIETVFHIVHGPLFWGYVVYSYLMILLGTLVMLYHLIRLPRMFKGQLIASLIGAMAPWVGNALYVFELSPWPDLDLTPFMFTLTGAALLYGLFRFRMLELTPIARDRLIESMSDALIVIDSDNRVVDLNPAFEALVGQPFKQIVGRPIAEIAATWPVPIACPEEEGSGESVMVRPATNGNPEQYYGLKVTRLFGREGEVLGRLVLVRDITAQKAVEAENLVLYQAEHNQRLLAESLRRSGETLSATLDFNALLDSLLEQLENLIPYDSANVGLLEDGYLRVARARGYERFGEQAVVDIRNIVLDVQTTNNLRWMYENRLGKVIPDTHSDPNWKYTPATSYIRSFVGAPVVVRNQVIGFFSVDKAEANFYDQSHADLLTAFSSQAALAMDNSRLYEETMEHLRREQCLNQITRIMNEGTDLPSALRRVVRLTCELVGADAGSLVLMDGKYETLYAPCLINVDSSGLPPMPNENEGLAWLIVETGQSLRLNDYAAHPRARSYWTKRGVHAFLGSPIQAGGERIGVIDMFLVDPKRTFSERDQQMVEAIANQTGVAVQNARLFKAAQQRAEEAETLRSAAAAVSSALDLDDVLNMILLNLEKVVRYDSAAIFLVEENNLRVCAGRGVADPDLVFGAQLSTHHPLYQDTHTSGCGLIIADAQADERFKDWSNASGVRGWMGVPLQARGQPIGLLTLDSVRMGAFDKNDAVLTKALADEAASAIERSRLFAQVQRLAITDPLTGLFNRRHFFRLAEGEFKRTQRYGSQLSLVMMDMDNLKQINDRYGHQAGDQMIELISRRCQNALRGVDILARYAGDEFVVLLPETGLESALEVAQRLREEIARILLETGEHCVFTSVSVGVAEWQPDCDCINSLVERADQALYHAKWSGKNQVCAWRAAFIPSRAGEPA